MAQIFLCHASEDKAQVREVYQRLRAIDGFQPWLDEEDLLPGQDWAREIPRALQASDFILIFLSRRSVAKRGYVQREMKLALDAWQELPEGTIHTIPVRLDDCVVPEPFRRYHYANLFDPRGFERLTRAIHTGLTQRTHFPPGLGLESPPDTIGDRKPPPAGDGRRSVPVAMVCLVIAAVSVLAALIVVPEVRVWLGLDKPREASKAVSLPREITTNIGMEFVFIPAGTFMMGSPDSDTDAFTQEKPAHRVTISQPFYLGKYEVTQAQWEKVMGTNPSQFQGNPNRPVERVSWEDVKEFITRLNKQEGWEVCRLPTEAQWEYAARAGTETRRYSPNVDAIAWYEANSNRQTQPIGQKLPNAWGLYDMLGNVWEWCEDGQRTYAANTAIDPMGSMSAGAFRIFRGGGWISSAQVVRAAIRFWNAPGLRLDFLGFRCASSGPGK